MMKVIRMERWLMIPVRRIRILMRNKLNTLFSDHILLTLHSSSGWTILTLYKYGVGGMEAGVENEKCEFVFVQALRFFFFPQTTQCVRSLQYIDEEMIPFPLNLSSFAFVQNT